MSATGSEAGLVVLIPVYLDQRGLETSLQSLLAAELPGRFCTLVVDDGSEPPVEIDQARYRRLGVRLERLPKNLGIVHALNRGLEVARAIGAEYLARLDAGDTVHRARFALQAEYLAKHPAVGLVGSDALFVDEADRTLFRFEAPRSDAEVRRRMHVNCCLLHPTIMIRTAALERAGKYSTQYPAAEDYELFFRLLQHTQAAAIPEPLTVTLWRSRGISLRKRRTQLLSRLRIQSRYFEPRLWESYLGIALTVLFFATPAGLVTGLKRLAGYSRY